MAKPLKPCIVIRDTREKDGYGWHYDAEEKESGKIQMIGTVIEGLDAGDYSLKGFEELVRIERKNGFCELFGNMTPKDNSNRFEREMEKLRSIPHRYILIETDLNKDTLGLSVPQFYRSPPCSAVLKWLLDIQMEYGVNVMFVGDAGKKTARYIFEQIIRKYS